MADNRIIYESNFIVICRLEQTSRKSHAVFLEVCERSSIAEQRRSGSFDNPYKFNDYGGKSFKKAFDEHTARSAELDEETGLYYYGARYYNPRTSVWLSVDPIALWQPVQEVEHYIEGQHNGGYFNPQNMNVYGYTYQNPVRYIDPTGMAAVDNNWDNPVYGSDGTYRGNTKEGFTGEILIYDGGGIQFRVNSNSVVNQATKIVP